MPLLVRWLLRPTLEDKTGREQNTGRKQETAEEPVTGRLIDGGARLLVNANMLGSWVWV